MKYIKISNQGLIEPQALHLVGASTKRNDNSKIGQFGSGNKYAMAFLLRNGYDLFVYSGNNEIKITTKKEIFRNNEFNVIYINDEKTSITTEMGKDWKFWQAIREIYCNAIDERNFKLDFVSEITPIKNETHFYIDTKKDVMEFVGNFNNYFATNKKVLFESKYGRILEKSGTEVNIYRKGVRCHEPDGLKSVYDYDFNDIIINENRLVEYFWHVEEKMWDLIYSCDNEEIILNILNNSCNDNFIEGNLSSISSLNTTAISDKFKETLSKINLAPRGYAGLLNPDEVHNHIIIPTKIFESIRGSLKDSNVADKFKVMKDGAFMRELEVTEPLQEKIISDALYFLKECLFDIPYEVKICIFDDKQILGCAYNNIIWISDTCIEKGVNEVVNTIIEEFIHLKYGAKDKTRLFQTSVITEFISYMKKVNSFSI